jgi:hypothetical protein
VNTLFINFSQKSFTKKTDEDEKKLSGNLQLARYVSLEEFNDWLYQCQRKDVGMQIEKKTITISK